MLSCRAHRGVFLSELAGESDGAGKASLTQGWEEGPPEFNSRVCSWAIRPLLFHLSVKVAVYHLLQLLFTVKPCTFCVISSHSGVLPAVCGTHPTEAKHTFPWDSMAPDGHLPGHHQNCRSFPGPDGNCPQPHVLPALGCSLTRPHPPSTRRFYLDWGRVFNT